MIYQGRASYPVTGVVLHTAAVPTGWANGKTIEQIVAAIDSWHKSNGWSGIGYHRVFAPNGKMGLGRSIYKVGAHVKERNRGTVGICMINHTAHKQSIGRFEDYFHEAQREAVRAYIKDLRELTDIRWVAGHNDFTNAKVCPGFRVKSEEWL